MPHVDLPTGIRIRYEERGPAGARPLVLAHGYSVTLDMWFPQVFALSQDYRLITWDARGHGGSSMPADIESYTMPALAGDLRGLLEALDAVAGAVIGGMSFGGQIAMQYAVEHPQDVHTLILSDATTRGPDQSSIRPRPRVGDWGEGVGLEGCMHAIRTRPDLTEEMQALDVPALVIVGLEDDRILSGIHRLEGMKRRRIIRFANAEHGTSSWRPREWSAEVLRFLADVEAGAPLGEDEVR